MEHCIVDQAAAKLGIDSSFTNYLIWWLTSAIIINCTLVIINCYSSLSRVVAVSYHCNIYSNSSSLANKITQSYSSSSSSSMTRTWANIRQHFFKNGGKERKKNVVRIGRVNRWLLCCYSDCYGAAAASMAVQVHTRRAQWLSVRVISWPFLL